MFCLTKGNMKKFIGFILMLLSLWKVQGKDTSSVTMIFGGDMTFNGILEYMVNKEHCTYEESLEKLKPHLKGADYAVANLESVVFKEFSPDGLETAPDKIVHSISDVTALKSLKNVGINCVSLANSHASDFLDPGINSTCQLCKRYGIDYFGTTYGNLNKYRQRPLILEKRGIKIGLLGYCATKECLKGKNSLKEVNGNKKPRDGPSLFSVSMAVKQAKELRKIGCHAVILFMNWDDEYRNVLTTENLLNIKKVLSKVKIDLIVGSHPHVTHGHWIVNNTLVASSLGNLIAPSYMTAGMNFNKEYIRETDQSSLPNYERLWYEQMRIMKDPSRQGRLLKIKINKRGIIHQKSEYLATRIFATSKHCMVVDKALTARWRRVCIGIDPQCLGTSECNYLECDGNDPLPNKLFE